MQWTGVGENVHMQHAYAMKSKQLFKNEQNFHNVQ